MKPLNIPNDLRVLRVDQIDSDFIDEACKMSLIKSLTKVLPERIYKQNEPELKLLLDFIFFRFTTFDGKSGPGG